jgi:MFS family permease
VTGTTGAAGTTARALAIAVVFVANGLAGPGFLSRLPERQADLGLSDSGLGLVLVGFALGALVASPFAGQLVGRLGSRSVALGATVLLASCLWLTGAAPSGAWLFAALTLVGAADAAMDIAMNANGAAYEDRTGRSLMHRLHAAWSLGALAAAGAAGVLAALDVPLTVHLAGTGAVLVVVAVVTRDRLVPDDATRLARAPAPTHGAGDRALEPGRPRSRWRWPLLALGAATVGGAVIEGAPTDWGAIQLERYGVGEGVAALGVAAFMGGMVAGRLGGDWLTDRLGGARVLRLGASLVAGGLAFGALVGHPAAFLAGLVVAGVGAAGFFPLAFSAAARTPGVSPGAAAATVSLAARLGFLAEPVLVGAVSELVGLRWAFGLVAATAVALAAAAPRIMGPRREPVPVPP